MVKIFVLFIFSVLLFVFVTRSLVANAEESNQGGSHIVVLETNRGNIELQLFPDVAPKTCQNFEGLVRKGYYNGIIFHRVIQGFMIQGGDPTGTGRGGLS